MPKSDPIDIMLAHNEWATRQILEISATLTPEQFHQKFEIGPGTLHNAVTHVVGAMRTWIEILGGNAEASRLVEGQKRTPAEILALLETSSRELAAEAKRRPLDEMVSRVREGKTYQFTRGAVLTHVLTHGVHHRAQCMNMMRHLGIKPLPPMSVTEWTILGEGKSS
jgi:uncharacterized damage-inducible protein DinB